MSCQLNCGGLSDASVGRVCVWGWESVCVNGQRWSVCILRRGGIDKTNRWVHECIWISSSRAPAGMIIECRQVTSITDQVWVCVCYSERKAVCQYGTVVSVVRQWEFCVSKPSWVFTRYWATKYVKGIFWVKCNCGQQPLVGMNG